ADLVAGVAGLLEVERLEPDVLEPHLLRRRPPHLLDRLPAFHRRAVRRKRDGVEGVERRESVQISLAGGVLELAIDRGDLRQAHGPPPAGDLRPDPPHLTARRPWWRPARRGRRCSAGA